MEDKQIVDLYFARAEAAISETQKKYGRYCHYIAYNILYSDQDAEECVNDTYIKAWNAMPPHRPTQLSAFLGKITRNTALDRYAYMKAQKRSGEVALKEAVNGFLRSLPAQTRVVFVRRYWYMSPVKEIARDYGMTVSNVKVTLLRTRNKFREYLEKEGIEV